MIHLILILLSLSISLLEEIFINCFLDNHLNLLLYTDNSKTYLLFNRAWQLIITNNSSLQYF